MRREQRLYLRGRYWWARLRDETGKIQRVATRCTDAKAAALFADEWERRAVDPSYRRAATATLDDAVKDYLKTAMTKKSEATQGKVRQKLGHYVRLWGLSTELGRIDGARVLDYIATREAEGVKPITIRDELTALRGVLSLARFRGTFRLEMSQTFPPRYGGGYKPRTRAPSVDEVWSLIRRLEARRGAHVAFIAATGARLGESLRAQRSDVSEDTRIVYLRGTKTALARREVPITDIAAPLLAYSVKNAPGTTPLYDPWGKLHRDVRAACRRAGIDPVTPNDLRRSFATWHRQAGVTAEDVSMLLGHATDTLAQTTYGRITGSDLGKRLQASVPNLYARTAEEGCYGLSPDINSHENPVPPARVELATNALGKREARGVETPENYLCFCRCNQYSDRSSVSILNMSSHEVAAMKSTIESVRAWLKKVTRKRSLPKLLQQELASILNSNRKVPSE